MRKTFDRIGIGFSIICLIHCLAFPILMVALPSVKHVYHFHGFHHIMIFIATGVAGLAFIPGYLRHKNKALVVKVVIALILILVGTISGNHHGKIIENIITSAGSILLIYCHFQNIKHKKCCSPCVEDETKIQDLNPLN